MRKKLVLIAVVSLVLLAGCAGLTTYEAPPAETDEDLADEYNYEITEQEEIVFEENVTVGNYTQDIRLSSWLTIYEKDISDELQINSNESQSPIVFGTINTPSVNISGEELNPLVYQSVDDVMDIISDETNGIEINDKIDEFNTTHTPTNETINVSTYESTFEIEELDATFDGYVYASIIELNDSIVLIFGGHPEVYDEKENIILLMENTTSIEPDITEDEN